MRRSHFRQAPGGVPPLMKVGPKGVSREFELLAGTISHVPALVAVGECYLALPKPDANFVTDLQTDNFASRLNDTGVGVAGMIFCSIFANEGLPVVPPTYLERACAMVRAAGGLIIADEVQSGFGRTGTMWGHELMGFVPDIVTLGKPMGNGYPISALITRADLLDTYRDRSFYFNTFAGAQVGVAAAGAVLDVIEGDELLANARSVGDYIRDGFRRLAAKHSIIDDIRGCGLWIGIELVRDKATKEPATEETARLVNQLKDDGILLNRIGEFDNVLKMRPPLIFNFGHADDLLAAVDHRLSCL